MLSRRSFIAGLSALLGASIISSKADSDDTIASIEARHGGWLGVFVLDTGTQRMLAHRADERFLMCSTFKGILVAMVLSRVDAGQENLANLIPYDKTDLVGYSPVTTAHLGEGALSVGALCAANILSSDNAAANLLLKRMGGPEALTAYVCAIGDTTTRFDRYELAASDRSGDLDTTTPRAIAGTVQTILLGEVLSKTSRARLEGWMVACQTGTKRLRASFPKEWIAGDKTGTGDGNCNDYAIVRRQGHAPLVMAAYYDAPSMKTGAQEAVLREVGAAVVRWVG